MADINIPVTNPALNASLSDQSKVDDSFKQTGTNITFGDGAVYNQNCGNQKELSRRSAMWRTIIISVLCDIGILATIFNWQNKLADRFESIERKSAETHQEMLTKAKEGTIWLLRDDIIKTIEFHEATKKITSKQFRRLKDEFDYYTSIGGNHDVKERFDDFTAKIYGTGEVKMVNEIQMVQERNRE